MLKDKIIEKVLNDISIDPRITDGIFDIKNHNHIGYLCEYLIDKGIDTDIVYEFTDMLLEKGKYPERQAYNRNGILVTFPTPQYKQDAIKAGTHFENDPTKGRSNLFQTPPDAGSPKKGDVDKSSSDTPTKTNLPISVSTASPPSSEKNGEDSSEPAQPMPNAFTTAAPQQAPDETPDEPEQEPTDLPPPQPKSSGEKKADKDLIKKLIQGDDYMLERFSSFIAENINKLDGDLVEYIKNRIYD